MQPDELDGCTERIADGQTDVGRIRGADRTGIKR